MKDIPIRRLAGVGKNPTFNIRELHHLTDGQNLNRGLHRHDFFFLLTLSQANGQHTVDFVSYPVTDNTVFFLRPGQVHQLDLAQGSRGYLMEFNAEYVLSRDKNLLRQTSANNYYSVSPDRMTTVLAILKTVLEEHLQKTDFSQEVIHANLELFFIELIRSRNQNNESPIEHNGYANRKFDELMELVESNVAHHLSVSEYAAKLNVSTYQLNEVTRNAVGKTCSAVINDYLLLEIKRYLLSTSDPISHIAHHLGYEDVSYFSRFFKKNTNFSPEVFRQNFK